MIRHMYIKELKQFFRKPFNIVFMLVVPMILILIMGYSMSNIIGVTGIKMETKSEESILYYLEENYHSKYDREFQQFQVAVEDKFNVTFEKVSDYENGCEKVDKHKAIALIKLSNNGFYYYRSPYNETSISKLIRASYENLLGNISISSEGYITSKEVEKTTLDSYTYFTFAELGLIIMYIALIVGQSVFSEKETKAFERIYISKIGINKLMLSKVLFGTTIGAIQIMLVYFMSTILLDVHWGKYFLFIFGLYLVLALFSSTLGGIIGLFTKQRTALNDNILMISIILVLMGGGLTPLSYLESIKIVSILSKISPLYWVTNSALDLSSGMLTNNFFVSLAMCFIIILSLWIIYLLKKREEQRKGVNIYE